MTNPLSEAVIKHYEALEEYATLVAKCFQGDDARQAQLSIWDRWEEHVLALRAAVEAGERAAKMARGLLEIVEAEGNPGVKP